MMEHSHPTTVHYDRPPDLYAAFLDPYLKYTSGLFEAPDDTYETAAVRMLDKHISFIDDRPAPAVLDIGPGWGALRRRLLERRPDVRYRAINPSREQNAFIRRAVDPDAAIFESPLEGVADPGEAFDAIFMIGSLCHIRAKEQELAKLASWLKPGGVLVVEDTFFISDAIHDRHADRREAKFVQDDVFGFARIQSFPRFVNTAAAVGLRLDYVLDHSSSYKKTVQAWTRKLKELDEAAFPEARAYRRYLQIGQRGWHYTIANYLVSLRPMTRMEPT